MYLKKLSDKPKELNILMFWVFMQNCNLPNNKMIHWLKFLAFADDNLNVAKLEKKYF